MSGKQRWRGVVDGDPFGLGDCKYSTTQMSQIENFEKTIADNFVQTRLI